jgi:hypothetical protein
VAVAALKSTQVFQYKCFNPSVAKLSVAILPLPWVARPLPRRNVGDRHIPDTEAGDPLAVKWP